MIVPKKMFLLRTCFTVLTAVCTLTFAAHANESAFRAGLAAKVKVADKNYDSVVKGKDDWLFFAPELRSVSVGRFWGANAKKVSRAVRPENADPLPAILDFKAQQKNRTVAGGRHGNKIIFILRIEGADESGTERFTGWFFSLRG